MIPDGVSDTRISNEGTLIEEDAPEPFHHPSRFSCVVQLREKIS